MLIDRYKCYVTTLRILLTSLYGRILYKSVTSDKFLKSDNLDLKFDKNIYKNLKI